MHSLYVREGDFPKKLKRGGGGEREREGRKERRGLERLGYGDRGERIFKILWLW